MSTVTVKTQVELDSALAAAGPFTEIVIDSPRGLWLELSSSGSASVRAFGSASVRASGSASVSAFDSASVSAFDSASVRAFDSASVSASKFVAVHLFSGRVTLEGGVLIDLTALDLDDLDQWLDYTGAQVEGEDLLLYKAVDTSLRSGKGFEYPVGAAVVCPDWTDTNECGGGLHLCPTPHQAFSYFGSATRFLRCRVARADVRPIGDPHEVAKCKVRALTVEAEVDINGRELAVTA